MCCTCAGGNICSRLALNELQSPLEVDLRTRAIEPGFSGRSDSQLLKALAASLGKKASLRIRAPTGRLRRLCVRSNRGTAFSVKIRMRGLLTVAFLIIMAPALAQTGDDRIVPAFGKLVSVHDRSITVRNQQGTKTFLITANTHIWRGDYVDVHHLQPGDDLSIRSRVSSRTGETTAVDIDANIARWNGTITNVSGDRVVIDLQNEGGDFVGRKATVIFWNKTIFLVDNASTRDLRVGAYLEVIGLVEKDTLQVWRVIGFDPTGPKNVR